MIKRDTVKIVQMFSYGMSHFLKTQNKCQHLGKNIIGEYRVSKI